MNKLKKIVAVLVCLSVLICILVSTKYSNAAASHNMDIRFVFTTDLHGRLTTTDYEQLKPFETGSLAKAYTLIQNAKSEKPDGNTFLFDLGDVLYSYETDTITKVNPYIVQPMYKTMAGLNYDAVTLGNHEFDYGYDYLMNQMNSSGLAGNCVVSNLYDAKTGKAAFNENMLITREVTTNDGTKVPVKIGVIGETIPVLSTKYESYKGVFKTEDIVKSAEKQAKALKEAGADIVVVLSHSGFGAAKPANMSNDAPYALTKVKNVDVVLCGHEHKMFPSSSSVSKKFYNLPGVDKKTGLVNGKNIVMASDVGQSIGVVDLTLYKANNKVEIVNRDSEVRQVKSNTEANEEINKGYDEWNDIFISNKDNTIGNVAVGKTINNYYGMIEDTPSIQMLNNALLRYALKYVNTNGKQYKGEPIVAASTYAKYGQLGPSDYLNLYGQLTESDLTSVVSSHRYLHLFHITGKQLREWLEWSASAFETVNKNVTWTDETMNSMISKSGAMPLVKEEWQKSWCYFYVFDGVNYTINPSVEPRYSYYGKKINDTNRISDITYNGVTVTDDTKLVLATQSLTGLNFEACKGLTDSVILKGNNNRLAVLEDYIKDQCKVEDLNPEADHNWNFILPSDANFLIKIPEKADFGTVEEKNWTPASADNINQYVYYKVQYKQDMEDSYAPNLVITSTNPLITNNNVPVAVYATDASGIKTIKYKAGNYTADSYIWDGAEMVGQDNVFEVSENGIYTVYAEDNCGNKTVSKIKISNINRNILQVPSIHSFNNRMNKITGTAEPDATIYFVTKNGSYQCQVDKDGAFSCDIPLQKANDTVTSYLKDQDGRLSDRVTVVVKRSGPNYPNLDTINNNDIMINGILNDSSIKSVFAVINDKVYVSSKDGTTAYKKSEKYNKDKKIVKTKLSMNSNGTFSLSIPALRAATKVTVYTLDYAGRVSKANTSTVNYVAPNPPVIYSASSAENQLYGMVYSAESGKEYDVTLRINGSEYSTKTDDMGYFNFKLDNSLEEGQDIAVYATETVDNNVTKSAVITTKVKEISKCANLNEAVFVNPINDKEQKITGYCSDINASVILRIKDTIYPVTVNADGKFEFPLNNKLKAGTEIVIAARQEHGSILNADISNVLLGKPYQPILVSPEVYNITKSITIASAEKVTVTLKVGDKTYKSKDDYYDDSTKSYLYDFQIDNVDSGNQVTVYSTNAAGSSPKLQVQVLEKAPDIPKVKTITSKSKEINGIVNLILGNDEDSQVATVENTKTKVYVTIKNKTYKAKIDDDGHFTIKIPLQKSKTEVKIWAVNAQGKGPSGIIKVK